MYALRFDLRTPDHSRAAASYAAALDMAAWGERNGCVAVTVSEHHGSADGYLPSPLLVAAAIAARTSSLRIRVAALLLPLHDPVRVAEDIAVLDRISGGRVSYVMGLGYRREEYDLYGVPWEGRGERFEEHLGVLLTALRDGAVDVAGRRGDVTPPVDDATRLVACGGRTKRAARRAARLGLDFVAQTHDVSLEEAYRSAAAEHGVEPGTVVLPSGDTPYALFVADDVDRAWAELGPHLLHDATTYASWNPGDRTLSLSPASTVDELRDAGGSHRIVDVAGAVELLRRDGYLALHPLCGGIPPDVAWPYVERVATEVLPAVAERSEEAI
ncbi:MAG TPA: LLM class flavin-dependent oxidoreductase [Acidimicrobiales bacterium]|nr:LLM class flavin-dependent oxidoreductase [Acidimicrobiales bacterium]